MSRRWTAAASRSDSQAVRKEVAQRQVQRASSDRHPFLPGCPLWASKKEEPVIPAGQRLRCSQGDKNSRKAAPDKLANLKQPVTQRQKDTKIISHPLRLGVLWWSLCRLIHSHGGAERPFPFVIVIDRGLALHFTQCATVSSNASESCSMVQRGRRHGAQFLAKNSRP